MTNYLYNIATNLHFGALGILILAVFITLGLFIVLWVEQASLSQKQIKALKTAFFSGLIIFTIAFSIFVLTPGNIQ